MATDTEKQGIDELQLQGINERLSLLTLGSGQFLRIQGLYPENQNLLSRIPGKQLLQKFAGERVLNLQQMYDVGDHILIQTSAHLYIATLDEIFGRPQSTTSLPYPTFPEEELMAYALIAHQQTQGTDAGALGGANNTFFARKLTIKLFDDSAFVTLNTGASQITLPSGSYRFTINVINYNSSLTGTYLFNVSTGAIALTATSGRFSSTAGDNTITLIEGQLIVPNGTTHTFEIRQAVSAGASGTDVCGRAANITGVVETYLTCKILKVS